MQRINKTSWIFEKNQQDRQTFPQTNQETQQYKQINKISNERVEITIDIGEIQRLIRSYFKSLYFTKLG